MLILHYVLYITLKKTINILHDNTPDDGIHSCGEYSWSTIDDCGFGGDSWYTIDDGKIGGNIVFCSFLRLNILTLKHNAHSYCPSAILFTHDTSFLQP